MRDLLLDIDRTRKQRSLEAGLRATIRAGRLEPGEAVPSSRGLAADLELSRATVVAAYDQLVAEGYLACSSRRTDACSGRAVECRAPRRPTFSPGLPTRSDPWRARLRPVPPCRRGCVARARCWRPLPTICSATAIPPGLGELRAAIASYLNRTRNTVATADSMVVVPRRSQRSRPSWRGCCIDGVRRTSPSRSRAFPSTTRSCSAKACVSRRCRSTTRGSTSRRSLPPPRPPSSSRPLTSIRWAR